MTAERAPGVWAPEQRALTVGLVLTVTMIAFEALGVATAMPATARELDGLGLYGWAFSATMLASLVGIAVSGPQVDRRGPAPAFAAGLVLFAVGLVTAGLAPSMPVLVAGRAVQGLGSGVLPPVAYASIGRAYRETGRARMFALLSSAWILPGLIGPTISGLVATHLSWRLVFLGILPVVGLPALLALPALRALGPPATTTSTAAEKGNAVAAVRLAGGAALVVGGLGLRAPLLAAAVVGAGLVAAVPSARRLLPAGTFRLRRGLPATVGARGLQTCAFFTAQSFLPLAITRLRDRSDVFAGLALTGATLTWTAGAWLQAQLGHKIGRRTMVVAGLSTMGAAILVTSFVVTNLLLAVPVVAWGVAGLGMGMAYSGISLLVLDQAPPGEEGTASSSMQLSDVLGTALGTGLGGVAVALGERMHWARSSGIAIAYAIAVVTAAGAVAAASRIRTRPSAEPGARAGRRVEA